MIGKTITVLDKGHVLLQDVMPRDDDGDGAIVDAARTSDTTGKRKNTDAGLIEHLVQHRHTSPLEQVEFKFHIKLPMSVARQFVRHRTASLNEQSTRYTMIYEGEVYIPAPERFRKQDHKNRQGSTDEIIDSPLYALDLMSQTTANAYRAYNSLIGEGVAREVARGVLPLDTYTVWVWKIDLHNLFHLLGLRDEPHAQWEIQEYARALIELAQPYAPNAFKSWEKWRRIDWYMRNTLPGKLQQFAFPYNTGEMIALVQELKGLYEV